MRTESRPSGSNSPWEPVRALGGMQYWGAQRRLSVGGATPAIRRPTPSFAKSESTWSPHSPIRAIALPRVHSTTLVFLRTLTTVCWPGDRRARPGRLGPAGRDMENRTAAVQRGGLRKQYGEVSRPWAAPSTGDRPRTVFACSGPQWGGQDELHSEILEGLPPPGRGARWPCSGHDPQARRAGPGGPGIGFSCILASEAEPQD